MIIEGRVIRTVLCFTKTKERLRGRLMVHRGWGNSKPDASFHPLRTLSSETLVPFSTFVWSCEESRNSLAARALGFYVNEWGWLRLLPSVLFFCCFVFFFQARLFRDSYYLENTTKWLSVQRSVLKGPLWCRHQTAVEFIWFSWIIGVQSEAGGYSVSLALASPLTGPRFF